MASFDVFNGDADGICALQQLRLHRPQPDARLVTGVKRDVILLDRLIDIRSSHITVLDISLDRNRSALTRLLAQSNRIFYADHHFSGDLPEDEALSLHIDPSPQTCTSLIIDRLLDGAHRPWALVGAFGDNLDEVACRHAEDLDLRPEEQQRLREMGLLLNYNGYGLSEEDLLVHPADLFREVHRFADPLRMADQSPLLDRIRRGYEEDMTKATDLEPHLADDAGRIYLLPAAPWANRIVGTLANRLAVEQPAMAHAVLLARPGDGFLVSVRAPLSTRRGADGLCRRFPTGGGREAAAGINHLPDRDLAAFTTAFADHFSRPDREKS